MGSSHCEVIADGRGNLSYSVAYRLRLLRFARNDMLEFSAIKD